MPLSVVDLYRDILPKTNCKDCGYPACLAFASIVVSEKLPLSQCPHLDPQIVAKCQQELDEQYAAGKWLKRDMAQDALVWAKERAASMHIENLPERIGGTLKKQGDEDILELPYFKDCIVIGKDGIAMKNGSALTRWEQVFIYNHLAQGGSSLPTGKWKGLEEIPNTISKMKSMKSHVEEPIAEKFRGRVSELRKAARFLGGIDKAGKLSADAAFLFRPLPKIPVMLLFWDAEEGFDARAKLLFDETVTEHLDIESILFLSERLREMLCEV
jgi:hypothetical protein